MVDIYLNPETGDIDLFNKTMRLTKDSPEILRQKIWSTLNTYRGEWVFDINEGIPYIENPNNPIQLMGRGRKEDFDSYIKQAVTRKPMVQEIVSYRSMKDNIQKSLSVVMEVRGMDDTTTSVTNQNQI